MRTNWVWVVLMTLLLSTLSADAKEKKDENEDMGKITLILPTTSCPVGISKLEVGYRETSKTVTSGRAGDFFGGGSSNTFDRPKGFENKIWLRNFDATRSVSGVEVTAIYFSAFGEYLNTVSFYCRRPLDPGGKERELKGNVDFPGAGYAHHVILFVNRVAIEDGSKWVADLSSLQSDITTQAGVSVTADQMQPGFKLNPNGEARVRNYLSGPVMLSE